MSAKTLSSPTSRLLIGLAITLAAVAVFSLYALRQIAMLKDLQARTVERNRKDSLQLLRIQNDLHSLGLAMRDMVDGNEPYPMEAWRGQFHRTRVDLDDALRIEAELAPDARGPRRHYISNALAQFWTSVEQLFAHGRRRRHRAGAHVHPHLARSAAGGADQRRRARAGRKQRDGAAGRGADPGHLRARRAADLLLPGRRPGGDLADQPVHHPLESNALRPPGASSPATAASWRAS